MLQVEKKPFKCIVVIAMVYLTMYIASYPVAYKVVQIGPIIETGAIFLFPFCYSLGDVVAEVYGYKISRQMIWVSTICGFIFCISILGIIHLGSPTFWHEQKEFNDVLGPIMHVCLAMTVGTLLGSLVNLAIITRWKVILNGRYFWLRSIGSSSIGELVFSIVAGLITFVGVAPRDKLFWLIFNGWAFKVVYAIVMAGPATWMVRILRRIEGVNPKSYTIKFNPFKKGELGAVETEK
jgi:queuosine precursor transporter